MNWISVGAINMAVAVACGAFAAHGLKPRLSAEQMAWWQTGTQYFFYHALGLLIVGMLLRINLTSPTIAWVMQLGIMLFTGSLYLMALGMPRWLGQLPRLAARCLLLHGFGLLSVLLSTLHQFNPI